MIWSLPPTTPARKIIVQRLQAAFPSHHIVAEEGGERAGSSEYRWYVDPLDGTTNFAHDFPVVYNVSIGLERAGRADRRSDLGSHAR